MVALAHNDMQMRLPILLCISYPLFQDIFCLFYELSVQVDRVVRDSTGRIVLAEDIVGCLLVELVHLRRVCLSR